MACCLIKQRDDFPFECPHVISFILQIYSLKGENILVGILFSKIIGLCSSTRVGKPSFTPI